MNHGLPPLQKVGVALVEQDDLLAQGKRGTGNLLESRRQHIELLPLLIRLGGFSAPVLAGACAGFRGALVGWPVAALAEWWPAAWPEAGCAVFMPRPHVSGFLHHLADLVHTLQLVIKRHHFANQAIGGGMATGGAGGLAVVLAAPAVASSGTERRSSLMLPSRPPVPLSPFVLMNCDIWPKASAHGIAQVQLSLRALSLRRQLLQLRFARSRYLLVQRELICAWSTLMRAPHRSASWPDSLRAGFALPLAGWAAGMSAASACAD
jgi:hypothetical protein